MAVVGIDLGTTNSLVAAFVDGKSVLVPNAFGEVLTPSVVGLNDAGEVVVGKTARERLVTHPNLCAELFKRRMGSAERLRLGDRSFLPEELSSFMLRRLIADTESYLGEPVEEAVVSVPAHFDVAQRAATKRAGALAGIKVDRLVNEPSAAALGCRTSDEDETFVVFDFGGGTLDVSVVECFDNVVSISAVAGDNMLGGSDFDELIAREVCRCNGLSFDHIEPSWQKSVLRQAEAAKRRLSEGESTVVYSGVPSLPTPLALTNEALFIMASELFTRMGKPIKQAVYDSDVPTYDIKGVVLVGGSCHMPIVHRYLRELLAVPVLNAVDCDTAVARGLGTYVGAKQRRDEVRNLVLTDICPHSLSTDVSNPDPPHHALASVIIPRNTTLPVSRSHDYSVNKATSKDKTWAVRMGRSDRKVNVGVFQGENVYAKDNVKLADVPVQVPFNTDAPEPFTLTFTYDINAILAVDVKVHSTGAESHLVYDGCEWKDKAKDAALLEDVKLAIAMDTMQVETEFAIERAQRIAAESNEADREVLLRLLAQYATLSKSNSFKEVVESTRRFNEIMDTMEAARGGIFKE